jgi:cardiolipin synthase (CMP-forming)
MNRDNYNWPNLVSLLRLLMAPLLIWLAMHQQPTWFLAAVLFSAFTDVLDGFLARLLDQITELGSHLDSWGDFFIYSCMAAGAWLLWPDIVLREKYAFSVIVASFTLPVLLGLIKFRTLTGYHTWAVKLAVLLTFIGYVLLFAEMLDWPFRLAAVVCAYAGIEEIVITLLVRQPRVDVRSLRHALKQQRSGN